MPPAVYAILSALVGLFRSQRSLRVENIALRHQLAIYERTVKRPRIRPEDRILWSWLSRHWAPWREVLVFVRPATVIAWQRKRFREHWTRLSRAGKPGRPLISEEIRKLIRSVSGANPLSGTPRIVGELGKLGINVAKSTVDKYRVRSGKPPSPTWKAFLKNHVNDLVSIDFCIVPTIRFKLLYVLIVLAHSRRKVLHFNVTANPTALWTAQQIVEAFPWDSAPKYLLRDRDAIYGEEFRKRVQAMGIEQVLSAPRSPWQNPFVERVIGTLRRDCLEHVVALNEHHLRRIVARYLDYYHNWRTHLSLSMDAPNSRVEHPPDWGRVVAFPELGYPAKNPIVMGLGHAATRDFTSFLRYNSADDVGTPNPLGAGIRRAYATGASQTGAFLRDFIYYGFNEDESHRKVFDGIIPTIAGGIRNHLNVRFADPDVYSDRDFHHDFMQVAYPPFAYAVTTDPISGITDGIMKRPATDPFVFQIDSGSEFWQLQGSLTQADGHGNPVPLPPNVRMYFNSSTAHGFATGGVLIGPAGTNPLCANPTPGGSIADTSRALTVALDQWVDQGIAPPPSNHPRVEDGTLVSLADYVATFPAIPFIGKPTSFNTYNLLDWGPSFTSSGGIRSIEPPAVGPSYTMFVPKADADGLDLAGVRPMPIRVPLGTNTGWNVRNATHRPQDSLCGLTGTYVPFATTLAERLATGDPRPSLQERYTDHGGFVYAVMVAAKQLVLARFLLLEDFYKYVQGAAASDVLRTSAEACSNLNGTAVPRASIGLPTTGANVTSTQLVAATPTAGEYCQVLGSIHPVDSTAPDIRFQLNLPTFWNVKSLMFGGGGYDGSIATGTGNVPAGPIDRPIPLARGYATFGSDSGHQANSGGSRDGSFAANDEAMNNFNGDALKKTFDAATFLIAQRYKRTPALNYFAGGSSGGREAFAVVQRWPQNFDGAISLYPAWNAASLDLQFGRLSRAFAAPAAYPNDNKKTLLYNSVMSACDALDGLVDGIITNTAACHFDPDAIRCAGGADTGDDCLSDAQIAAYNAYNTDITFSYSLGSGETHYPGFNVFAGADTRGVLYLGTTPPTDSPGNPSILTQPYWGAFWEQWVRFFVTRDPLYNALTLDPQNPGIWQSRVSLLTQLQDVNSTDLTAFQNKGGKLLIAHGNADALVSTRSTEEYWSRLIATLTAPVVSTFARYYEIPGYGHASGTAFTAAWDSLTALENWVERGVAPANQIVADANVATRGRTRPLCEYPLSPRYTGTGDVNTATSFTCATFPLSPIGPSWLAPLDADLRVFAGQRGVVKEMRVSPFGLL